MNNNQQPKPDPKGKAIASFVLGIVSVLWNHFLWWIALVFLGLSLGVFGPIVLYLYLLITSLISIVGIILGIQGLKSSRKNMAIVGIILCVISFLIFLSRLYQLYTPPIPSSSF